MILQNIKTTYFGGSAQASKALVCSLLFIPRRKWTRFSIYFTHDVLPTRQTPNKRLLYYIGKINRLKYCNGILSSEKCNYNFKINF